MKAGNIQSCKQVFLVFWKLMKWSCQALRVKTYFSLRCWLAPSGDDYFLGLNIHGSVLAGTSGMEAISDNNVRTFSFPNSHPSTPAAYPLSLLFLPFFPYLPSPQKNLCQASLETWNWHRIGTNHFIPGFLTASL